MGEIGRSWAILAATRHETCGTTIIDGLPSIASGLGATLEAESARERSEGGGGERSCQCGKTRASGGLKIQCRVSIVNLCWKRERYKEKMNQLSNHPCAQWGLGDCGRYLVLFSARLSVRQEWMIFQALRVVFGWWSEQGAHGSDRRRGRETDPVNATKPG